ncbi:MFS transporter [Caulobacter sp. NIBR2454]|uniref:MFS transporter n=1 Tax=Caulobacter sp. NIBR2454 TaxID=3015996 RepID=UPI0022B6394A|nr:MFS transporter [Caulobacter sp. NIBR2454]
MSETGVADGGELPPPTSVSLTPQARLKAILGGSAGNLVEWYDWFAYSSFSLYFAPIFFPKGDQTAQLLQAAAIFAVGFLARPLGAWIMGVYADRAGRRAALSVSVAMMCAGALVIALTPGFDQIGAAAPIILLLARILQGLSVGGEYGASATYMSEMAGKARRGFWSSFQYVTLIAGQLIALGVLIALQRLMPAEALAEWGWRIPFFIGALLAVVVFWIRRGLEESAAFTNAQAAGGAPRGKTMMLFLHHPRETLMILGLTAGGSLGFYAFTTYMQKFLVNTSGFTKNQATEISAGALFCFMVAQPLVGWLSDKVGRKTMLVGAFGLGSALTWPIMTTIAGTNSTWAAFGLMLSALLILSGYTAISAVIKAELFPVHVRALGVALPYALANAVFGGTAESVALSFKAAGAESGFYLYVTAIMAVAFVVALILKDTARHSRIVED